MTKLIDSLKARRDAAKTEGGFSLIDVVVTVAIIVALSVGGFIAYSGLVDNAKQAAVTGAADQLRTAATVAVNDEDIATGVDSVILAFNGSADGVTAIRTAAAVTPSASTLAPTADPAGTFITVYNNGAPGKVKSVKLG